VIQELFIIQIFKLFTVLYGLMDYMTSKSIEFLDWTSQSTDL